jgi:signal transduction histidine kinase
MATVEKNGFLEGRFEGRLEFERLIADLSSRFINLPPSEVDREIEDSLRRVCEFLDLDLAVLWQWSGADPDVVAATHFYFAQEGMQPPEPMRQEHYPWYVQQVLAGRMVGVSSPEELPPEAAVDLEYARLLGIKSNLCLPLLVGGAPPVGALAFNTLKEERGWTDALVNRLQLVAQVFANALARKRADEALRESEERLAAAVGVAGLAFIEIDFGTGTVFADDRLRELLGIPLDLQQGLQIVKFWKEHLHPDDAPHVLDERKKAIGGKQEQLSVEYRYRHPVRGEIWIRHIGRVAKRDATGRAVTTFAVLREVTDRRQREEELRDLSRRLIRAHEEERALLARELHDDVTQRLALLAIEAGRAELTASGELQAQALRSVREGLVRISEDIHSLAYQLHPAVLEELGLAAALRAECERLVSQGRVDLSLELDPLPEFVARDAALCLFRVAQAALNNVTRHAGARAASVTLRQIDGGLLLAVRDDGVGFDPASQGTKMSLGLASMRERVRLVNGTLEIESAPGRGTAIIAWVPAEGEAR